MKVESAQGELQAASQHLVSARAYDLVARSASTCRSTCPKQIPAALPLAVRRSLARSSTVGSGTVQNWSYANCTIASKHGRWRSTGITSDLVSMVMRFSEWVHRESSLDYVRARIGDSVRTSNFERALTHKRSRSLGIKPHDELYNQPQSILVVIKIHDACGCVYVSGGHPYADSRYATPL